MRKLRKVREKGWIGGVCAGIGYWLGIPTWVVRLVLALSLLLFGFGAVTYLLLWVFMPAWEATPEDYETIAGG